MLRFKVFENGAAARSIELDSAFLVGSESVPVRGQLRFANGQISCEPRTRGPVALSIMWPIAGFGRIMLETTRLQEREEPYNLHVELARGRLMRISQKREDWGLYDFPDGEPLYREVDQARTLFVDSLTAPDDVVAARLADEAIAASTAAGERLAVFHADVFLKRRRAAGQIVKRPLGCGLSLNRNTERYLQRAVEAFDFAVMPFRWRDLEPREGEYRWELAEGYLRMLRGAKLTIRGGSLVSFSKANLPDWIYLWEQDYDHVQECLARYIKGVLKNFGSHVHAWEVIDGIHCENPFHFSLEQLMDLTRVSATLVKKQAPRATALIGITLPWGEYHARDARTIPPMLYADMVMQSGINFDAFGLSTRFGSDEKGLYVRDLMQISTLIDKFGNLGKPLHVTASDIPSGGEPSTGGTWRGTWTDETQAAWLREFCRIALSKPFVETVTWANLADDAPDRCLDGVLRSDLSPKPAYEQLTAIRRELRGARGSGSSRTTGS